MGRGRSTQQAKPAEPEATDPVVADATGGDPGTVEQENLGGTGDIDETSGVSETEEIEPLDKEEQQAAIASSLGGTDQYPYVDRTAVPMHERTGMSTSPLDEASQAELNPAFTPKPEDGGPVHPESEEGIGTEPNALELRADAAENAGGEELRQQVEERQAEGEKQQMDVDAVNEQAEERAPEGVDAGTGEGEATPAGSPSGMEPSSDGEAGTAGASE